MMESHRLIFSSFFQDKGSSGSRLQMYFSQYIAFYVVEKECLDERFFDVP